MSSKIWLFVGPGGSGKTTLLNALVARKVLSDVISYTTRLKRPNEEHGKDYRFVTKELFLAMVENGQMAEHVEFNGNLYGLSKDDINRKLTESHVGIVVEPNGVLQLQRLYGEAMVKTIFLLPPSQGELVARIRKQNPNVTDEQIQQRLLADEMVMEFASTSDMLMPPMPLLSLVNEVEYWIHKESALVV